jgi:putative transcriptional regulator
MSEDTPQTAEALAATLTGTQLQRLKEGRFDCAEDIAALRQLIRLSQTEFARAVGISVYTLRNWEQGRRSPEGPALALLRIAAKHPQIIRENRDAL